MNKKYFKANGRTFLTCFLLLIITIFSCLCFSACGKTQPYLQNLNVDVTVNGDGSARIVETHTVDFTSRDDDWWNYYKVIGGSVADFTVSVDGVDYGNPLSNKIDLDDNSYNYKNVSKGLSYYYNRSGGVEVGVIMPKFERGVKKISFSYTVPSGVVNVQKDCAEIYYQFFDESNTLYVQNFTGKIKFPTTLNTDVNQWVHIDTGNAMGVIEDGENVSYIDYVGEDIADGVYLEARILLPKDSFSLTETTNALTKDGIIAQEKAWYDEYQRQVLFARISIYVDIGLGVLVVGLTVLMVMRIRKIRKPLKLENAPVYYREIPEGWSAGEMSPLFYYYKDFDVGNSLSATMLELCRKRIIEIKPSEKGKQAVIVVGNSISGIKEHEYVLYTMLQEVSKHYGGAFSVKQMENYFKKRYEKTAKRIEDYKKSAEKKIKNEGLIPKNQKDATYKKYSAISGILLMLGGVSLFITLIFGVIGVRLITFGIACIIGVIAVSVTLSKIEVPLKKQGQEWYDIFHALEKFMLEFGNMDEHELPELVLWEEFMVYATAMGIAEQVEKQLRVKYPKYTEIVESGKYSNVDNTLLILYLCSPRSVFGGMRLASTMRTLPSTVNTLSRNAKIASNASKFGGSGGFGGGGGFRGGGGGFHGGGMGAR